MAPSLDSANYCTSVGEMKIEWDVLLLYRSLCRWGSENLFFRVTTLAFIKLISRFALQSLQRLLGFGKREHCLILPVCMSPAIPEGWTSSCLDVVRILSMFNSTTLITAIGILVAMLTPWLYPDLNVQLLTEVLGNLYLKWSCIP